MCLQDYQLTGTTALVGVFFAVEFNVTSYLFKLLGIRQPGPSKLNIFQAFSFGNCQSDIVL